MLISMISHFKLRPIPWNPLYREVLLIWESILGSKGPSHCDVEITEMHQTVEGEMPDCVGYQRRVPYKDGGYYDIRLYIYHEGANLYANLFTTFDIQKFETRPFIPYYLLTRLATEYTPLGKLHFGAIPDVVYTTTETQMNLRQIFKVFPRKVDWSSIAKTEDTPQAETQTEEKPVEEPPAEQESVTQPAETQAEIETQAEASSESPVEKEEEPQNIETGDEPKDAESELVAGLRGKIQSLTESLEDVIEKNRKLKNSQKELQERAKNQKSRIDYLKQLSKKREELVRISNSNDIERYCNEFDIENDRLSEENDGLKQANEELQMQLDEANGEIKSLRGRLKKLEGGNASSLSLLDLPQAEHEKIEDEFGIALMAALHHAIDSAPTKTNSPKIRSIDVWEAFIKANPTLEQDFRNYCKKRDELLNAMKRNDLERNLDLFEPLGLKFSTHANNHGKINFADDDRRYQGTVASTPSERASGPSNSAADLRHAFLY